MLDVSLPPTGIGEIGFAATATMRIVADTAVGPWVAFELFERLKVDSAAWENGEPATVVRGKESPLLWVKLDRQIRPGDTRTLKLAITAISSTATWTSSGSSGR